MVMELDASKILLRLSDVYFFGVLWILGVGCVLTTRVTYVFFSNFKKMNSVVKSYMSVILPDIFMVVNFWFRDMYNIKLGKLDEGPWCGLSAFVAVTAVTALNSGAVCVAYTTYRLVSGNQMPDKLVVIWNIFSWVFACLLAAIFLVGNLLGPYKGLYCCVKETRFRPYAVSPIIVVTFTAIGLMCNFYYKSYKIIKASEGKNTAASGAGAKASDLVLKRGILLVSVFYCCWSIIIFEGFATAVGTYLPASVGIIAAWLSKLQPIIDSVVLLQMLDRILGKGKVNPDGDEEDGRSKKSVAPSSKAPPPSPAASKAKAEDKTPLLSSEPAMKSGAGAPHAAGPPAPKPQPPAPAPAPAPPAPKPPAPAQPAAPPTPTAPAVNVATRPVSTVAPPQTSAPPSTPAAVGGAGGGAMASVVPATPTAPAPVSQQAPPAGPSTGGLPAPPPPEATKKEPNPFIPPPLQA